MNAKVENHNAMRIEQRLRGDGWRNFKYPSFREMPGLQQLPLKLAKNKIKIKSHPVFQQFFV